MAAPLPSKLRHNFLISCGLLVLIFILSFWSLNRLIDRSDWVEHTNQVLLNLENIISLLKDAETGQRGYLLTEDEEFLEPYIGSYYNIIQRYKETRQLTLDNPRQQAKMDTLISLINRRFGFLNRALAAEKMGDPGRATLLPITRQGKQVMDQIRQLIKRMQAEEIRLKGVRYEAVKTSSLVTPVIILMATFLSLLIAGFSYRATYRAMAQSTHDNALLRQAQENLKELNRDLENKVTERTGHLTQAQEELLATNAELAEKNRRLAQTNADLDSFIYTASHDLKAPIVNIEAIVDVLRESECYQEEEPRLVIGMLGTSTLQLKEVIEGLASVLKIQESTRQEPELLGIRQEAEDIRNSIANQFADTRAEIIYELEEAPEIVFSRRNFRSILYNLIQNALKYRSPLRPPLIHISSRRQGDTLQLSVRDNGIGMPHASREKIFELFRKQHNQVEGTGVGLFIVKRIMDQAQGRIEVESEPDQGTTFHLYFPQNS
jgi:signal transduction histidine kinase